MQQHFVSSCYLANFTDPATPSGHEPYLWRRRRGEDRWRRRAPRKVARAPEYYSAKSATTGVIHRQVEDVWASIESYAAPVLKKFGGPPFLLTSDERVRIAYFVAATYMRAPAIVEHVKDFIARGHMTMLSVSHQSFARDPDVMRRTMAQFASETGYPVPPDVTPDAFDPAHFRVEVPTTEAFRVMLPTLDEMARRIWILGWTFFVPGDPDDIFVTSDNPYCMVNPEDPLTGSGLARRAIEVTIPLHPRVALVARHREPRQEWHDATSRLVYALNARRVLRSRESLFSSRESFPGVDELVALFESGDADIASGAPA